LKSFGGLTLSDAEIFASNVLEGESIYLLLCSHQDGLPLQRIDRVTLTSSTRALYLPAATNEAVAFERIHVVVPDGVVMFRALGPSFLITMDLTTVPVTGVADIYGWVEIAQWICMQTSTVQVLTLVCVQELCVNRVVLAASGVRAGLPI
jgi:hypothetical protein